VKRWFIEPESPWEKGYNESFNGKLRDKVLIGEGFFTLKEAKAVIENWRWEYHTIQLHRAPKYRPPAPEAVLPLGLQKPRAMRKCWKWGSSLA
jgi:putative transposase